MPFYPLFRLKVEQEESLYRQSLGQFEREHPNELWEWCFPLTIIDDHFRFSPCIKACTNEQHVTVKAKLIETFEQYGLPKQFNVDNGNP